ncbi:MAG TPA: hypothetical protein VN898_00750 [Candidatus Binatia bacterium]|nr:hypothetical protein [Candidatus Binatia bacterium]
MQLNRPPAPALLSRLVLLGAAIECGFGLMLLQPPGPGRVSGWLVLFFAAFACYALAVRAALRQDADGSKPVLRVILGFAILFRLTFLFASPALSNDLYRYLWDGRQTLAGANPYGGTPAERGAAATQDAEFARMDHADVPTVYPPAAQALFALGAAPGRGVQGIKTLVVVADLLLIGALMTLMRRRAVPDVRVLIYAWSPLAVTEAAWSGHIEPAGVLCVILAGTALIARREAGAALLLSLGGLVKLFPLVLFAPLVRSIRVRFAALALLLFLVAWWPFRAAGAGLVAGLSEYAGRWLGNESLFGLAHAAIAWIDPTPALKAAITLARRHVPYSEALEPLYGWVYPIDLAKGTCALVALGVAAWLVRRRVEPLRGMYLMTGAVLLLSPTAHPWYFLWILPWLCLFPSVPWILLCGLVALAYVNLGAPGRELEPYPWIRLVEYLPFFALLMLEWLRGERRGIGSPGRAGGAPPTVAGPAAGW